MAQLTATQAGLRCPQFACQPIFFNQRRFRQDLAKKTSKITVFKDAIAGVNTHFDMRFQEGEDIRFLITERASFIDLILHYAWNMHSWGDDIALIAVGGYGRAELHPHSDIDILILLNNHSGENYREEIQLFITFLWDIGLKIGSSVRTINECVDIARQDITVATNLLEARRIAGNDYLRDQLQILTGPEYMWPLAEFYEAKLAEQKQRHKKYNYTEYDLEPNVKNSPGGLRDIQTLNWLAKHHYAIHSLRQLAGLSFFTDQEYALLQQGEAFLWRVRYGIHKLAGRPEERLLFEYQRQLAVEFGFADNNESLAVEQFMHHYYRTATALRQVNDILLRVLGDQIAAADRSDTLVPLSDDFQLRNQYIEVTDDQVFDRNPSAMLEIFVRMCENRDIKGVQAQTIRLLRERRALVDQTFRDDPKNHQLFLKMFKIESGLVIQLKRMKRYGILGRYLPEFGSIEGQMQHDLFHRYTVDAHTLQVMQNVRAFRSETAAQKFPLAQKIIDQLEEPELLYIAALYHDIGKGRGGDHSVLGAKDAKAFCLRHEMRADQAELVSWLVEHHLLMSYVSQKKDISDPSVIHNFAEKVGSTARLNFLYTLTVADMCGTNPDIWNSWRASLMHQLYSETKEALQRGLENSVDQTDIVKATQRNALEILAQNNISEEKARELWGDVQEDYFVREGSSDIAWQTEALVHHPIDQPLILIRDKEQQPWKGASQIFIHVKATKNVFVAATTLLTQLGLNIQDARIYSSIGGHAIDTFYVLDENHQPIGQDQARINHIKKTLLEELKSVEDFSEVIRRKTPRQLKYFSTPTRTTLKHDEQNGVSILEVISPDRPGLLATIGRIFMDYEIDLQNAKIQTLGERVEDVFFISDSNNQALSDAKLCEELQRTICQKLDQQVRQDI